ncbi:hypothetical protein [Cardinium endosymbiont of Oedothorax gibbosus]|nr:hypothetical protein [Cardinium endosymbiont of Oedothorax gibbosus]
MISIDFPNLKNKIVKEGAHSQLPLTNRSIQIKNKPYNVSSVFI